ncbi:hypothetical protein EDC02_4806 [Micromonospora sp. Llam0]|uniref:hypothetical protein n=1 Tax=Micromonospora sp. Llam0 TaxID=2485143 RepID=UPI000F487E6A|nr:hypothetical protein [Micromonospora sp. Llam0]ROO62811.1 hypothetical protein EDC02_4806 [Micromonospora sp. Llam0]
MTESPAANRATPTFEELDRLSTEQLREQSFELARQRRDLGFFWSITQRLSRADDASELDGAPNSIGPTVEDAVALWREFTGHEYGESEPLLRAAFIDYLLRPGHRS